MVVWQERWHERSRGALTLGGSGGRERHKVVGIVRALGQRGKDEIDGINSVEKG
jgi:hypothetical protein